MSVRWNRTTTAEIRVTKKSKYNQLITACDHAFLAITCNRNDSGRTNPKGNFCQTLNGLRRKGSFNSVLRPFQDYFSSYEMGLSVGGRNRENSEKNHFAHPEAELGLFGDRRSMAPSSWVDPDKQAVIT